MKAVIQRVAQASVAIDGSVHGAIGRGFLVLVGIRDDDTPETVRKMAEKIVRLRVFDDENGKMNLNLEAVGGKILSISQFTLFADCSGAATGRASRAPANRCMPASCTCSSTRMCGIWAWPAKKGSSRRT
jgi:D-tyrosyl-tRNA(Tyr) deacylase